MGAVEWIHVSFNVFINIKLLGSVYKENNHSHITFAPDVRGQIKDGEIINFHAPP